MSVSAALPEPTSQRDEDAQYYRAILHELIEIGAGLARALHRQASAEPAPQPAPAPDLAIPFDRIARTIRRTIALARKIAEPEQDDSAPQRLAARKRIIREVEDAIQREADSAEADALHAEFRERLDGLDLDDDIASQPIAEIIAAIRRDLGIAAHHPGTHPWKRRTPQDVRDLCARAARPPGAGKTGQPRAAPTRAAPTRAAPPTRHPCPAAAPTRTGTGPPP